MPAVLQNLASFIAGTFFLSSPILGRHASASFPYGSNGIFDSIYQADSFKLSISASQA